jgi:hypothetical protein
MRVAALSLLVVVSLVGCDAVLGISDHSLAGDDGGPGTDATASDGSSSGADSAPDHSSSGADSGPSDAADAACTTGQLSCSGTQPEKCIDGVWLGNGAACSGSTPACLNGACVACAPGALQCSAQQPQKCDATGAWANNGSACTASQPCSNGACLCTAGQTTCSGQQPQTCDSTGHYQNQGSPCGASVTCSGGACIGICGPGQTNCLGNTPQSCGPNGQWQNESACSTTAPTCSSGQCVCQEGTNMGGVVSGTGGPASEWLSWAFVPQHLVQVSSIQLYTMGANVALLASSGGACPGSPIWQGATTSGSTYAWQTATVSPPITLTPGTTYFLASESSTPSIISGGTSYTECSSTTLAGPWSQIGTDNWVSRLNGTCN